MALGGGLGAQEGYRAVRVSKGNLVLVGGMNCAWDH